MHHARVVVKFLRLHAFLILLLSNFWLWLALPTTSSASSTIFGGGPFYTGGTSTMNALRASGYTTVMLWCIHVDSTTGNLIYNDQLVRFPLSVHCC